MLNNEYKTTYYYAEDAVVIEYSNEKRNVTVISINDSIGIYGLVKGEKIKISKDVVSSTDYELIAGKRFEKV